MNTLSQIISHLEFHLRKKNWQMVTAESCTGGLIAASLTDIPGSSDWFERGFVTYSNLSKQEMLGVGQTMIAEYGAVSEQVARAMAQGALNHSAAHLAISVTGIAGPGGGSEEKPVGMVCIGWAIKEVGVQSQTQYFSGSRSMIRQASCEAALKGALELLNS